MARFRPLRSVLRRAAFAALASWLSPAAPAWCAELSIVMDASRPLHQTVVRALERDFGKTNRLTIYNVGSVDFSNPIAKGRFLARVSTADLIIPIGPGPTLMVSNELEDLPAFFIAGGTMSGAYLAKRHVAGVLAYSPESMVETARALFPRLDSIAVLFTPGYESVVRRLKAAAAGAGIAVTARRVAGRAEIGGAAREVTAEADLLWVAADPLLVQDVIFAYLVEESLRAKRGVVTPVPALIQKGALFCGIPDIDKVTEMASRRIADQLAGSAGPAGDGERILTAPLGGSVLVNRRLIDRWAIPLPKTLRLWEGRTH